MEKYKQEIPLLIPGEEVQVDVYEVGGKEAQTTSLALEGYCGGGHVGTVFKAEQKSSNPGETERTVALKVMEPPLLRKKAVAGFDKRAFTGDGIFVSKTEIEMLVLVRNLLANLSLLLTGRKLVVPALGYTLIRGVWTLMLEWCEGTKPKHGLLALGKRKQRQIKEQMQAQKALKRFLQKARADGVILQADCHKSEPRGQAYVFLVAFLTLLTFFGCWFGLHFSLVQSLLAFFAVACPCFWFAGASWFSAENFRKGKDKVWRLFDVEQRVHIGISLANLLLVLFGVWLVNEIHSLNWEWKGLLVLVLSPGYFFVFQAPVLLSHLRRGVPIPCGLDIEGFEDFYRSLTEKDISQEMRDNPALEQQILQEIARDIQFYKEREQERQRANIDWLNRLYAWLFFGRKTPFSWQAVREKTIEALELKNKVSSAFALRLRNSSFGFYLFCRISVFPLRFFFNTSYRRYRVALWRAKRIEKLVKKKKINPQEARRLFEDGKSFCLFFSYFLLGPLYRIFLEKGYLWKILRALKSILFGSRDFIEEFFQEKFGEFLAKQKDVLSPQLYRKARGLARANSAVYGWVAMALLLKFTKPISYTVRFLGIGGFFGSKLILQGVVDFSNHLVLNVLAVIGLNTAQLSGFWGSLVLNAVQFSILWIGIGALHKSLLIWLVAWAFRLRFIPRLKSKICFLVVRVLIVCFNVIFTLCNLVVWVLFGAVNCLPTVSFYSVEIVGTISPQRKDFYLLFLILWQASVRAGVSKASFGVWQGIAGQFLWGMFLIDPVVLIVNGIFRIYKEVFVMKEGSFVVPYQERTYKAVPITLRGIIAIVLGAVSATIIWWFALRVSAERISFVSQEASMLFAVLITLAVWGGVFAVILRKIWLSAKMIFYFNQKGELVGVCKEDDSEGEE